MSVLTRALTEPVRAVVNVPPQHGKSETILHWIPWVLLQDPRRHIAYVTYATEFSRGQSRKARRYAVRSGVGIDPTANRLEEWLTLTGGGLFATGINGPLTGKPVKLLIVDDPIKNREEAESATIRNNTYSWLTDVAFTRLHPDSSAIVVQTRWHVDDVSGRLATQRGWEVVRLPAVSDFNEALWPAHRPIEFLDKQREQLGEYSWWSMFQGEPRPRGGALFCGPPAFYDAAPSIGRDAIGVDLAYSAKTHADYSVALTMRRDRDTYYVTGMARRQVAAPDFSAELLTLARMNPGAPMRWYAAGTEKGSADFIRAQGVPLDTRPAIVDKYIRAQGVAAAWNAGKILIPKSAPYTAALVAEVGAFTGINDPRDDIVDAMAAAFDALQAGGGDGRHVGAGRRTTAGLKHVF